jgi:hypothetical protein
MQQVQAGLECRVGMGGCTHRVRDSDVLHDARGSLRQVQSLACVGHFPFVDDVSAIERWVVGCDVEVVLPSVVKCVS